MGHIRSLSWGFFLLGSCLLACASESKQADDEAQPSPFSASGTLGGGDAGAPSPGELEACATSSAEAESSPLYLVFMFDRSLSMFGAKLTNRWTPCKKATQAFLASAESKGISASLHYFPQTAFLRPTCEVATYAAPAVSMTALPSDVFKGSLDTQSPEVGTPMDPAMTGAVEYAQKIANGEGKNGKVAIVLVGDGEPIGCGSSVASTSKIVEGVAKTIPTYVIGIGDGKALDAIARAGGTKGAVVVSDDDAAATEIAFRKALDVVASSALACDYAIPAPPVGETFERGKVNIIHRPANDAPTEAILYNPSCAGGAGWRYDDEGAPTRILLCDDSCQTIKETAGKVDVLFGCETKGGVVK